MVDVKMGDVFGSTNPMALGRAINAVQWFWSKDGESKYSHSGIIIDGKGKTIESLWTVKSQNIFTDYAGDNVIIARPDVFDHDKAIGILKIKQEHFGQRYPFWRLAFHLFPPVSKVALFERLVCSELTAKYLYLIGARHSQYKGTNPDTLADEWRNWKNYDVIFEGKI